jgi:CubicO group peptidase (beta-lactamase class C family)
MKPSKKPINDLRLSQLCASAGALPLVLGLAAAACGSSGGESEAAPQQAPAAHSDVAQPAAAGKPAAAPSGSAAPAANSGNAMTPAATAGAKAAAPMDPPASAGAAAQSPVAPSGSAGSPAAAGTGAAGEPAAAGSGADPSTTPFEWPIGKPEDFDIDSAWLDEAADSIQRSTGNRYGMVVVRKGTLIYEKYWDGGADDKHIIYSCTKSWGSSLIGIAVTQGLLTVKDEVRKWVPMPAQGVSEGATLEHVLTQSAHTNPPGQTFSYNSGYLLNTAPEILGAAAGMTPHQFFDKYLAKPLNLAMSWPKCPAGGCAGTRYAEGFINFGNQPPEAPNEELPLSSVRDQAKLGWLWANNGKWGDEQLIDPSYIEAGSKPGAGFRGMYGYLMWIENDEQFGAIGGVGNCYVNIMPSKQLVIAVMGNDSGLGTGGGWSSFRSLASRIP